MSGIFKSVKKTIKKVGKVIKKIAPYLLIAAAVYFGGAYLMSSGAPSAGAAGSVGTSFTKAGGVWKAFLSGMGNGTASQSAAAYAEASWQASQGVNALPLSGQVAAGTSAVNALSNMGSTAEAVSAGVDLARNAWTQSGGNVNMMQNIVQNAQTQASTVIENAKVANVTPAAGYNETFGMGQVASHPGGGGHITGVEGTFTNQQMVDRYNQGIMYPDSPTMQPAGEFRSDLPSIASTASALQAPDIQTSQSIAGGTTTPRDLTSSQMMYQQQKDLMTLWRTQLDDSRAYNQQILADRNKIAKQQMWMQGTGLLLSALGASKDSDAEKARKRSFAWEPSGEEEYASGRGKIYPIDLSKTGILS